MRCSHCDSKMDSSMITRDNRYGYIECICTTCDGKHAIKGNKMTSRYLVSGTPDWSAARIIKQ